MASEATINYPVETPLEQTLELPSLEESEQDLRQVDELTPGIIRLILIRARTINLLTIARRAVSPRYLQDQVERFFHERDMQVLEEVIVEAAKKEKFSLTPEQVKIIRDAILAATMGVPRGEAWTLKFESGKEKALPAQPSQLSD